MKKVTFAFILVLFVSVSVIFGLAGDHSANKPPSFAADWPEGLSELLNRDEYAGGFFINASDWFFFRGDTSSLNRFLADYSKLKDTPLTVVLHAGRSGKVKSWPQKNIARDWQVAVINRKWISDGPKTRPGRRMCCSFQI